jgi:hypothetical protein
VATLVFMVAECILTTQQPAGIDAVKAHFASNCGQRTGRQPTEEAFGAYALLERL